MNQISKPDHRKNIRQGSGRLILSLFAQVAAVSGTVLVLGGGQFGRELYYLGLLFAAIGAALTGVSSYLRDRARESAIEEKEAEIVRIESAPTPQEDLLDTIRRHIKIAVGREEVGMLRAEARSNNLFRVGRAFLIASILGPVAAALLYLWVDPISTETTIRLRELHDALGPEVLNRISLTANRDWRILVAGVSFGLLFLAAARGLLSQQGKEATTYLKLAEKINFLERLDSVVSVRGAHPHLSTDPSKKALAEQVLSEFLGRDAWEPAGVSDPGDHQGAGVLLSEELVDIVRTVNSSR